MVFTVWDQFLHGKQADKSKGLIQLVKDRYLYYTNEDYTDRREIDLIAHIVARAGADWQIPAKRQEALDYFNSEEFKKHAALLTFRHDQLYAVIQRVWKEWCHKTIKTL